MKTKLYSMLNQLRRERGELFIVGAHGVTRPTSRRS